MKKSTFSIIVLMVLVFGWACSEKAVSNTQFIFKPAPNNTAAAKFLDSEITQEELMKDIRNEVYELEQKIFEKKMNSLRSILLERLIKKDPKFQGMTTDAYLEKYIANRVKISEKEIEAFILERKIPKSQVNDHMKERIRTFLTAQKKQSAVKDWMNRQMANNPVEVYLTKPKAPVYDVEIGSSPVLGNATAKVTLVEFSDFECPYCSKGAAIVGELKKKYGSKLKVVFKNYPLPFHKNAMGAAHAALCAREQSNEKFWKMHDHLFANQNKLDENGLKDAAKKLKLDMGKFDQCFSSKKHLKQIEADKAQGAKLSVKSTPTFFVNGKMVNGALPVEEFSKLIDEELAK